MPDESTMIDAVVDATGDSEVAAAGRFRPVGFVGHYFVGFLLGNAVGSAVMGGGPGPAGAAMSDVGAVGGAALGGTAGMARAASEGGGIEFVVGASPRHVHVVAPLTVGADDTEYRVVHSFDRDRLEVSVKARAASRRLVLEASDEDSRIELEGVRLPGTTSATSSIDLSSTVTTTRATTRRHHRRHRPWRILVADCCSRQVASETTTSGTAPLACPSARAPCDVTVGLRCEVPTAASRSGRSRHSFWLVRRSAVVQYREARP